MTFQANKAHKPGRKAGKSAREKHKAAKNGERLKVKKNVGAFLGKSERSNAAKQTREHKRENLVASRRQHGAPKVATCLAMSEGADISQFWNKALAASDGVQSTDSAQEENYKPSASHPQVPTLACLPDGRQQVYWVPPPKDQKDALAIVQLARYAEVVLLVFSEHGQLGEGGEAALSVLKEMGLPDVVAVVMPPAGAPLKVRAACKKIVSAVLESQGLADLKVFVVDSAADYQQLLRHVAAARLKLPTWRQNRAALLAEASTFVPDRSGSQGTLVLRGWVRGLGLSANQLVHLPGVGDLQLGRIEGPTPPRAQLGGSAAKRGRAPAVDVGMEEEPRLLAMPDSEACESPRRENQPDSMDAEQTWPTEEELAEASKVTRRLPKGTSAYQAAWILDQEFSDEELEEVDLEPSKPAASQAAEAGEAEMSDVDEDMGDEETSFFRTEDDFAAEAEKPAREQEEDDMHFPDEMDTPQGIAARQRFAKFRGLKSWRSSPWDPREDLPADYARIFAFQSFKQAEKRARALAGKAGSLGDAHGVASGTFADLHILNLPSAAAACVASQIEAASKGEAPPVVAFGLLQHEAKLSVLHFAVKKASGFQRPLPNKSQLLFVTAFRTYEARPIFSTDEPGNSKSKMLRFLQPQQAAFASVYAPITYQPTPLLAFHVDPHSNAHSLAVSGMLRSCDPGRVILKRVVLSGYPVKVHKKKAVVRWMFHSPEDVRWFKPLDLWTKHGLRGRIREPVGTHGTMKCIFDGTVKQQDAVCASLYKRVYPKWPESPALTL